MARGFPVDGESVIRELCCLLGPDAAHELDQVGPAFKRWLLTGFEHVGPSTKANARVLSRSATLAWFAQWSIKWRMAAMYLKS